MEKLIKHKGSHITISDEPIKVGDWVYWEEFDGEILQVKSMDADYIWFAEGKGCLRAENAYPPYKVLHKLADPVSCVDLNGDIMKECYKVEDATPSTVSATPKLTLTQYEFLKNEVAKTIRDDSQYRLGQTWFNELVAHIPAYEFVRGSEFDPFYRDEVLLDLFYHILDEQAYESWRCSIAYQVLHGKALDKQTEAVPVDTSGSELSDFVEGEDNYDPHNNNITASYMLPDDYVKAMEDSLKLDAERYIREAEEVKQKELKLMENAQVNIVHENEHTPMIANNSTSDAALILKPGASIGYASSYAGDYPVSPSNINWGSSYAYKTEHVEEKTVNVTIRFSSKKDLDKTFLLIRDLLSTNPAAELSLQGLEIAQW